MVKNKKIVRDWKLKQDEKWNTVFQGKSRYDPNLSMVCPPCLKFYSTGVSYNDCNFAKSHVELKIMIKKLLAHSLKVLEANDTSRRNLGMSCSRIFSFSKSLL